MAVYQLAQTGCDLEVRGSTPATVLTFLERIY